MSSRSRTLLLAGVLGTLILYCGNLTPRHSGTEAPPRIVEPLSPTDRLFTVSEYEPAWTELQPRGGRVDVTLPFTGPGDFVLMVSLDDVPQRSTEFVIAVTESTGKEDCPHEWQRVQHLPQQPVYPPLPSAAVLSDEVVTASAVTVSARVFKREVEAPAEPLIVPSLRNDRGSAGASPSRIAQEAWFLPQQGTQPPGRETAVSTTAVLTYGRVRVVLDDRLVRDAARQTWCLQLATRLHNVLIPRVEAVFGPVADRTASGTLTVVVTPAVRMGNDRTDAVRAFVLSTDYRLDLDRPQSHACDAIYIDPELSGDDSDAILTHELTHAAQFCRFRRECGATPWPLQDWMIEGTAHAAEVLLTHDRSNVAARLQAFHQAPERSPLVVRDGTTSGRWRDPCCRGAACSFFTWAAQHHGLEAIAQLSDFSATADSWMKACGQSWAELHRAWLIDLAMNEMPRCHPAMAGEPISIRIDGGATAFFRLPGSASLSAPRRLLVEGGGPSRWRATLLRMPTNRHPHSSTTAFASPVTTFR